MKTIDLAQVCRGETFIFDEIKFIKLDDDPHASFVLTADVLPKSIPFDQVNQADTKRIDYDNFIGSYLQNYIDSWLHKEHPVISRAVIERPIDLLSMCGETIYGTPCVFGRALTLDEYRRYHNYIPRTSNPYWLATSYSPYSSYYYSPYYVNAIGRVDNYGDIYYCNYYARPALYLESSTQVKILEEDK